MIRLKVAALGAEPVNTLQARLQMAVELEFATLPPYLYSLYSIAPGTNAPAFARIKSIVLQEMVHMCLACNMLNAIGGRPQLASAAFAAPYPRSLPGDIGTNTGDPPWKVQLLRFSEAAMQQGMRIEEPEDGPIEFPELEAVSVEPEFQTIGEFYHWLDRHLKALPAAAWHANRNQITDTQFFAGELFAVNGYDDAHRAISRIVSQGEGTKTSPIDFEGELAHYYRFAEVARDQVLTKANNPEGFVWGAPLGVDWASALNAIPNPSGHDFSNESQAAQQAQTDCDRAFMAMIDGLQAAVDGTVGALGIGVRHMFDLRIAARTALSTPLRSGAVAGPQFVYRQGESQ